MQLLWTCVLAVLGSGAAGVQPPESTPSNKGNKRLDAVVCTVTPEFTKVKPGTTFHVAVVLQVAPKWHLYWPGQNDAGMPVAISMKLPEGWTAGEVGRPTPERHVDPGDLLEYVHEGKVVFTVPVTVSTAERAGHSEEIGVDVDYLVCKESCIPGSAQRKVKIELTSDAPSGPAENATLIKEALEKQPKAKGWEEAFTAAVEGTDLVLTAKDAGVTGMAFMPREGGSKLLDPLKTGQAAGKQLRLRFQSITAKIEGVVELKSGNKSVGYTFTYRPLGQPDDQRAPADLPRSVPPGQTPERPKPDHPK